MFKNYEERGDRFKNWSLSEMHRFGVFDNFDFLKLDYVLITIFLTLSFFGLVILASASCSFF